MVSSLPVGAQGLCAGVLCPNSTFVAASQSSTLLCFNSLLLQLQALAEQNACDTTGASATPMAPPETDAQPLGPSPSAAKGRPRGRKPAKQASINSCEWPTHKNI